jgi:hypothetical protein
VERLFLTDMLKVNGYYEVDAAVHEVIGAAVWSASKLT